MTVNVHRLPNGVRIATEHMPSMSSATIGVWVTAGGRHEKPAENGIAHFLEHMAFKGTDRRSSLAIAEEIENVGGYINAYTSREMTAYYARVLQADVPLALDVLADILLNPLFDAAEIDVERGVILQEIGQSLDTPDDVIFDWLQETAFPDQAMGRTILGPAERVSAFTRDDLSAFVDAHYGPEQLIIAAAGGVDHDEIVKLAETLFGGLTRRAAPAAEPATFHAGERREAKALEQAHFTFALEAPGYRHDDLYTAHVFAMTLGGGMSSRLFQEAREKRGLCYTIFAQPSAFAETGMMTVYAGTGAEQITELAHVTIDELKRAAGDMSQAEIDRARAQLKAGMLMGLESPTSRVERLARNLAVWDRVLTLDEVVDRIEGITVAGTRALAESMVAGTSAMALYGPVDAAPDLQALTARLAA